MKYGITILFVIMITCPFWATRPLWADILRDVDALIEAEDYPAAQPIIVEAVDAAESDVVRSELYWRLALAVFMEGKEQYYEGAIDKKSMIARCETCREHADKAIAAYPESDNGYLLKARCTAERIVLKGIFYGLTNDDNVVDMLKTAVNLNPDNFQALAELGEMYMGMAAMPFSNRKNIEYAVSFSRAAVDIHDSLYVRGELRKKDFHTYSTLARSLKTRKWSAEKRQRSLKNTKAAYERATEPMDRRSYYEGTIEILNMSDMEEAIALINMMVAELEALPHRNFLDEEQLQKCYEKLATWRE